MAQTYSIEFKEEACKRVQSGVPAAQVARELGINVNTLYTWMSRFKQHPTESFVGQRQSPSGRCRTACHQKAHKGSGRENEFLKKASAFFAKNLKWSVIFIWSRPAPDTGSRRWRGGFRCQKAVIMRGWNVPKAYAVRRMKLLWKRSYRSTKHHMALMAAER